MNDEPHPLVRSHQLLRQLGGIHFEIRALSEREANMHAELSQILSEAWNERQKLTECYFSLLRALASLCEDSSVLVESRSQKEIAQCLLKLLHEHGLKFIDSKEGCLFDPVHHHCLTSIAGILGLLLALRRKLPAAGLFAWAVVLLPSIYYFIIPGSRFRNPLEPFFAILIVYLFRQTEGRWGFSIPVLRQLWPASHSQGLSTAT